MLPHAPNPDAPSAIIEVISSEPVTPHNRALYEAGKTILTESLKTGREFCQFMTTTSLAAVPVYLGLLTFASEHGGRQAGTQVWLVIPALLFVLSSVAFAIGLQPRTESISLDVVQSIEDGLRNILSYRRRYIRVGFTVFLVAAVMSVLVLVWRMRP